MIARLIVYGSDGQKVAHQLRVNRTGGECRLQIVMATSAEDFGQWLFFFLRDHGAYIETDVPEAVTAALELSGLEPGIVTVNS